MTPAARIDSTVIDELIDLGPDTGLQLVQDLVELFNAEAPNRIATMRDALTQRAFTEIANAAHAMRGGAGNLGAYGIGELCTRIEAEAKAGNSAAITPLINDVEQELALVQQGLAQRIAGMM